MDRKKFTVHLIDEKVISQDDLDKVLKQNNKQESLIELLISSGYVSEQKMLSVLSRYFSIPPLRLANFNISQEYLNLIPKQVAEKYKVLPIGKVGGILTVAMADPLDVLIIDDLKKITGCEINPVISLLSEIKQGISSSYLKQTQHSMEMIIGEQEEINLELVGNKDERVSEEDVLRFTDDAPVIKFTNYIFKKAVQQKASDILIEPLQYESRIRLRVDGLLKEQEHFSKHMHSFVVSRIKVLCNLNITEHRLPQEGRFRLIVAGRDVDFRVSILPSSLGEKAVLRILDKAAALLNLDLLGFEDEVLKKIKTDAFCAHGLILVCGPTGSGKTTTLYSIINHIYTPQKNIITVEDPIEYRLKGINQVSVNPQVKLTFSSCLRSILRQDPDIIMIGEIRDADTADIAIKAALTGHLVLSTLHTTTSAGSITRLINMGVEPFLLSSTLIGVLTQRLIRRLCPKCGEEISFPDALKKKYLLDSGAKFYKPGGCRFCRNNGYEGRTAICEYLRSSSKIKSMIDSCVSEQVVKSQARKEGMVTLREDGMLKLKKGLTALEEVLKATAADEAL